MLQNLGLTLASWKKVLLAKLASLGDHDPPALLPTERPMYFAVMIDGSGFASARTTAEEISYDEGRRLLASGKLTNLVNEDWIIHTLTLKIQGFLSMRDSVDMAIFVPGDRFLIANFARKSNHDKEPTVGDLMAADLTFSIGTFN